MDAVARFAAEFDARVDIRSIPGKGTSIVIELPARASAINVLNYECGSYRLAVAVSDVSAIYYELPRRSGRDAFRGRPRPEAELSVPAEYFRGGTRQQEEISICLKAPSGKVCLPADRLLSTGTALLRGLGGMNTGGMLVSSCFFCEDGKPAFLVDAEAAFAFASKRGGAA
jgi:chemotaxis protein histidine kinase CheA